jgi:hypothetical protein
MSTDNKGFLYEETLNKSLKKQGLQSSNFQPAASNPNAPDAELLYKKIKRKVEVKLDTKVDFGQGSLDYDVQTKKWGLGGAKTPAAEQMREFLTAIGVIDIVNKKWGPKGPPRKYTVPTSKYTKKDVEHDYSKFKDEFVDIPGDAVANYYNSKDTYYMQIGGGYGLYYMGNDVAELGVPSFNLKLKLRIRIKRGGSTPIYNYRFTTAIQAVSGSLTKSPFNLDDQDYLKALKARSS